MTSVILNRIQLGENFAKTGLDEILPRLLLMNYEVWYWEGGIVVREKHATSTTDGRFGFCQLETPIVVKEGLAPPNSFRSKFVMSPPPSKGSTYALLTYMVRG